jgi:hypothetical protein
MIAAVADRAEMSKADAKRALDALEEIVLEDLATPRRCGSEGWARHGRHELRLSARFATRCSEAPLPPRAGCRVAGSSARVVSHSKHLRCDAEVPGPVTA